MGRHIERRVNASDKHRPRLTPLTVSGCPERDSRYACREFVILPCGGRANTRGYGRYRLIDANVAEAAEHRDKRARPACSASRKPGKDVHGSKHQRNRRYAETQSGGIQHRSALENILHCHSVPCYSGESPRQSARAGIHDSAVCTRRPFHSRQ
jgi:hypothetical protein